MTWYKDSLQIRTKGKGLYPVTTEVQFCLNEWGMQEGICFLYVRHTSASLVISESYDPSARLDLETFMDRLVPEQRSWMAHTLEGADDSPSHMRSMLTNVSLSIPVEDGQLLLGSWQGIYLFEHRKQAHSRTILLRGMSVD